MDNVVLMDGLLLFFGFIAFVTLHEYAHAWTAVRCGDDTPRLQGRLTLDPIAHIDLFGTIILPLALVLIGAASGQVLLFGWGRPVQVNLDNFKQRQRDDILVSAAGPAMNLLIAVVMLAGMRLGTLAGYRIFESVPFFRLTDLTLFLCFFNLLPIPPLDGAHILRNLLHINDEAYAQISRYSFLLFIIVMRSSVVSNFIGYFSSTCLIMLARLFGWHLAPA
ncbi:MAG TPA: site-2 protease family protein [Verrucomicrobiae bacterium]|nr:site-2 protease family protein [Verrucomicrobiae bacterium]